MNNRQKGASSQEECIIKYKMNKKIAKDLNRGENYVWKFHPSEYIALFAAMVYATDDVTILIISKTSQKNNIVT